MKKVIENGKVAVIYSPGFGAGWYTWNMGKTDEDILQLIFDPTLVEYVRAMNSPDCSDKNKYILDIERYAEEIFPEGYFGGASDLRIEWMPIGTEFQINEYDGSESINYKNEIRWMKA